MKRFKVEQAQKSCKFADNCVDLSTHAVVGGGGNLKLSTQGFYGVEKSNKKCYISDILHHYRNKKAFTLAEVLITLGIIGVVVAMTMPTLIANHREKETVVRLKKAYSTLSNAYIGVLNDYGDPTNWDVESWDDIIIMFSKYISNVKICDEKAKGCFSSVRRKDLVNNDVDTMGSTSSGAGSALIMSDGIVAGVGAQTSFANALSCDRLNYCFHFAVDINGDKGPNRWGVDTFTFHVTKDRVVPRGAKETHGSSEMCDPTSSESGSGWWNGSGCGAWVIQMENLDYLKCVNGNQKYCSQKYYFQ